MPVWGQLASQDAASPLIEEIIFFHDFVIVVLGLILTIVGFVILALMKRIFVNKTLLEGQIIECAWTLIPAMILVLIGLPSLILLYMLDEAAQNSITVKAVGHQWYWSYEYSDFWGSRGLEFDSYISRVDRGTPRLLDADSRLTLPIGAHVRVVLTSADVLHSWTVPVLGVKADACPGRLNQIKFISHRPGVFFGQCSEICGANHRFIPVALELIRVTDFISWVKRNP